MYCVLYNFSDDRKEDHLGEILNSIVIPNYETNDTSYAGLRFFLSENEAFRFVWNHYLIDTENWLICTNHFEESCGCEACQVWNEIESFHDVHQSNKPENLFEYIRYVNDQYHQRQKNNQQFKIVKIPHSTEI